ncbi:TetR/AcrR family transcriptional regulator [Maridesulfovibrio hydrothermalis]|uniref:Transcriptional regulator, TetR family n=1 Tax=Maridesulfovibrio hydrothermalis AM13 = DSM 14728 TaxID=1121451 RepID=L0RHS1_9BACT|nr:TetR/AcrR family transcriptional regulator [Maridesulfovibrio hydrothermalis]CCO25136.1 Transcriptional regulator, TetR family [Maridesulfovibrio hydrothermalis AM13 = DSM 14728]
MNANVKIMNTSQQPLRMLILDAARKLFAEHGYAQVSMRKLATTIGYSPTTIYHHFKDKKELFLCLTEETYRDFLQHINQIITAAKSPREALKKILHTLVDMGLDNPNAYRVGFMMESELLHDSDSQFQHNPLGKTMYNRINSCVKSCMAKNVSDEDVLVTAHSVIAAAHGLTALLVTYPRFEWGPVEKLKKQVIDSAVDAIA